MWLPLEWGHGIPKPLRVDPQSEAWVEAASWIAEEKRARLREDPTEEAFARLAFQLCMQRTQETDDDH
jgi:hypothetical protein